MNTSLEDAVRDMMQKISKNIRGTSKKVPYLSLA